MQELLRKVKPVQELLLKAKLVPEPLLRVKLAPQPLLKAKPAPPLEPKLRPRARLAQVPRLARALRPLVQELLLSLLHPFPEREAN